LILNIPANLDIVPAFRECGGLSAGYCMVTRLPAVVKTLHALAQGEKRCASVPLCALLDSKQAAVHSDNVNPHRAKDTLHEA
jgi:hypothetical protein